MAKRSRSQKQSGPAKGARPAAAPRHGAPAEAVEALVQLLKTHNLAELEVEREGIRIRVRRDVAVASAAAPAATEVMMPVSEHVSEGVPAAAVPESAGKVVVKSPIVGTFYRSPSPDADPYVEEGDVVKKGQVLCIVEAMKLMNEIESEVDGRVVKILAESTKPVEYGQPLFLIDPAGAA
jgi:acetyl-CoA carboxylase biotin carboxyl carrier protein